ncbi:MAG: DUF6318 family protein [Yaniella sp.]|nr:DUF6318 family protein [Yaniella sp.]
MPRLLKQPVPSRIFASLAALTLCVVLAGCSNDDDAELDETMDASEIESAEYVPASADGPAQNVPEPKLPAVATENTEEGAEATLKYFWEAESLASLTGNTRPLELVSSGDCEFCMESVEGWGQSYDEGAWAVLHGDIRISVSQIETAIDETTENPVAHVYFELEEPPTDFYESDGEPSDTSFDTSSQSNWFALLFFDATAQRWEIEWLGLEESVDWEE